MQVVMSAVMAGPSVLWNVGDTIEMDDATGERLIAAGFAEAAPDPEPEAKPKQGKSPAGKRTTRTSKRAAKAEKR